MRIKRFSDCTKFVFLESSPHKIDVAYVILFRVDRVALFASELGSRAIECLGVGVTYKRIVLIILDANKKKFVVLVYYDLVA